MAKKYGYAIVSETTTRLPGRNVPEPRHVEQVDDARVAARRATELARTAPSNSTRFVTVYDAGSRRQLMVCFGPTIQGQRSKRSAQRSFAMCQITFEPFKKAIKFKPKRSRRK